MHFCGNLCPMTYLFQNLLNYLAGTSTILIDFPPLFLSHSFFVQCDGLQRTVNSSMIYHTPWTICTHINTTYTHIQYVYSEDIDNIVYSQCRCTLWVVYYQSSIIQSTKIAQRNKIPGASCRISCRKVTRKEMHQDQITEQNFSLDSKAA